MLYILSHNRSIGLNSIIRLARFRTLTRKSLIIIWNRPPNALQSVAVVGTDDDEEVVSIFHYLWCRRIIF